MTDKLKEAIGMLKSANPKRSITATVKGSYIECVLTESIHHTAMRVDPEVLEDPKAGPAWVVFELERRLDFYMGR